jgi:DNA-binding transcriptional MerR regulator
MRNYSLYPIKYVSQCTGLPAYLIRTWELRYDVVSPRRSNSNRRLYCANDIRRLQLISKAVASGHSISQVANLPHEELLERIASSSTETHDGIVEAKTDSLSAYTYYRDSLHFIAQFDAGSLQATLDRAAVSLTRMALILDVIIPLNTKVREMVKIGKMGFINLNVATMSLQTFLWEMLRTAVVSESAPKIVIASPSGQQSVVTALALALIGVESGWRSIYLGPNLPANEIAAAVKSNRAQAVALSITQLNDQSSVETEIKNLKDNLSSAIEIIICANGKFSTANLAQTDGIYGSKLKNFRRKLESLTRANTS